MKKSNLFFFLLLLGSITLTGFGQVTTQNAGNYTNNGTWIGSAPNAQVDDVLIIHDVTLNANIDIEQDFTVQAPGSLTSTNRTIQVSSTGNLTIGNLNSGSKLEAVGSGSITIKAGDTVYVEDLILKSSSSLTVEAGAVVYCSRDFKVLNNSNAVIDGKVFVTNKFEVKNAGTITGSGSVCAGSSVKINSTGSVFGSNEECPGCIYTNGCTFGTILTNWNGANNTDWFNAANWSNGVPNSKVPVVILASAANMPNINAAGAECFHMTIQSGASLTISGVNQLDIHGNMNVQGSFIPNTSTVNFASPCWSSELEAAGTVQFHNLLINTPFNLTVKTGFYDIIGTLTLNAGSFETADNVTLKSTASGTARIAEILGVGITGEIVMERYIDAGQTYWRYFGSAVQGATLEQFNDDFTTAGYPGSLYPNFPWISAYNYNETAGAGSGYQPASGATQVMAVGEGWQIWCGDTITGTQPFTFDLRGVPNQGNISFPVTYTNTLTPTEDGFNLVSNPYPSTIDWEDADWTKTNMANAVYIQNPDNQQYATYIAGASTNGGSRYIASQQAFWVQAFLPSPVLMATEGVKSSVDQAFIKNGNQNSPGMTITLEGNSQFDEAVLRHVAGATDGFDYQWDAQKYWGGWGDYPQLSAVNGQQKDLTVHSFEKQNQTTTVPLRAIVFQDGQYNIKFDHVGEMDVPCIKLEDTYTGILYDVFEGASYTFDMDDTTYAPRFLIHIGQSYEQSASAVSCLGDTDGAIEIDLDDVSAYDYELVVNGNSTFGNDFVSPLQINGLESGIYTLNIPTFSDMCGITSFNFVVGAPSAFVSTTQVTDEWLGADGAIDFALVGGTEPYTYYWDNGQSTQNIVGLTAGSYTVQVEDGNGCEYEESFLVKSMLSIEDENTEIHMFYNAAENSLIIQNIGAAQCSDFLIYSTTGQQLARFQLDGSGNVQAFKLPSQIAAGTYVLTSTCGDGYKFVVPAK